MNPAMPTENLQPSHWRSQCDPIIHLENDAEGLSVDSMNLVQRL